MKSSHKFRHDADAYLLSVVFFSFFVWPVVNVIMGDPIFSHISKQHPELSVFVLSGKLAGERNPMRDLEGKAAQECDAIAQQIIDDECNPNPSFEPSETEEARIEDCEVETDEARIEDCEVQPEPDSWLTRWWNRGWQLIAAWRRG